MKFLNKMERKLGRYAIPNLTKYIIITYIIGVEFDAACIFFSDSVFSGTGSCTDSAWTDLEAGELGFDSTGTIEYLHFDYAVMLLSTGYST